MSFFKISLIRSGTGLPRRQRDVLQALGLKKRNKPVFRPVNPDTAGMIMVVKELLAVKEVESPEVTKRKSDPGFYVEQPVSPILPESSAEASSKST